MKKLNDLILSFLALGLIAFVTSCGSDEPEPTPDSPTISISSPDFDDVTLVATGKPGDVVTATINITAEGGFNVMRIAKVGGEADANFPIEEARATGTTPTTHSYQFSYTLLLAEVGEDVSFVITAVDDIGTGQTSEETLTLETEQTPARAYTAILLQSPLGDLMGDTFFSTSTGMIYSPDDVTSTNDPVSGTIDFGFYFGTSSGAHLASPLAFESLTSSGLDAQVDSWTTLNDVTFKETAFTTEMFMGVDSWEEIDEIYEDATVITAPNNIAGLEVDQVFVFETDDSKEGGAKRGVIMVTGIVEDQGSLGQIEIEVVVQETPE